MAPMTTLKALLQLLTNQATDFYVDGIQVENQIDIKALMKKLIDKKMVLCLLNIKTTPYGVKGYFILLLFL